MKRNLRPALVAALLVLLVACAGAPETRYFALSSSPGVAGSGSGGLSLAVGPVDLPRYLDRPHIVVNSLADRANLVGGRA